MSLNNNNNNNNKARVPGLILAFTFISMSNKPSAIGIKLCEEINNKYSPLTHNSSYVKCLFLNKSREGDYAECKNYIQKT